MLCRNTFSKYLLLLLLIGLGLAANSNPQTVQWSSKSYGPDGPWQAVTLSIGTPPQTFDLLPGGVWASPVLAPSVCANGVSCSVAKEAGFYNPSTSNTAFEIDQTGKVVNSSLGGADAALGSLTGSANWMFDTMSIHLRDGIVGNTYFAEVQDFNMLVVSEAYETLPDGTTYPMQIGHLSLGAPEFNESWLHFPPNPRWNGTLLPSALFEQGNTPSNSYGLHIGSEALGIPGSLNIGGFDPSRALGPVSSQVYAINRLPIDLLDIGIGVTEGASPFNFTSQIGLLAEGNSSLGVSTSVLVEPQVPYIYLLQSSCDAITEYLPVTFQMKYGLYFWNTKDPSYERIVTSPSFLSFTFRLSDSISQNMTIKVPLTLLNLTLTQPIIDTPTQYLPLRPGQGPSGGYELGRAFLQAAFIGVNWQTAQGDGEGAWFLAQAPGPNTPSKYPLTVINAKDSTIIGSNASWEDTWKGSWTVIESSGTSSEGSATSSPSPNWNSILPVKAIIGIVLGVGIALLAIVIALFFHVRSRTRRTHDKSAKGNPSIASEYLMGETVPISSYKRSGFGPRELEARNSIAKPVEMAG